jgi:hypothetical protein
MKQWFWGVAVWNEVMTMMIVNDKPGRKSNENNEFLFSVTTPKFCWKNMTDPIINVSQ